jgi:SIR2-like domain
VSQEPISPESPRLLATMAGPDWRDVKANDDSGTIRQKILSDVLLSPNLIVLCGLGTSMYLKDQGGKRLAPTMSDLWSEVSKDSDFKATLEKVFFPPTEVNIERFLSQCQLSIALSPDSKTKAFIERAEKLIVARCRFVTPDLILDRHELFLRKAARRSTRLPRMRLFTTNYDLTFESAASRTGFIAVDGFSHTSPSIFDGVNFSYDFVRRDDDREGPEYIPNVFHLYKIHGSVDWELRNGRILRTDQPPSPLIIYPRNSKFESSYNPPFLEMMSRLQLALRQPNTGLLIVGFGFNDEHLAQPLLAAIRSNVALKALIVSPLLSKEGETNPHIDAISQLILSGDDRLAFLETSFEQLVTTMPDLVAVTEEEEHRKRLSDVRRR